MSNQIVKTDLKPIDGYVAGSSRYSTSSIVYYGDLRKITFPIYHRRTFVPTANDMIMVITAGTEYRPDLVSKEMYGTVDFWWKIMEANGIYDIFDFKTGVNIRLPANMYGL